jgi:hypothetical protein
VSIENVRLGKQMMTNAKAITVDTIAGGGHQLPWKNKDHITKLLLQLN